MSDPIQFEITVPTATLSKKLAVTMKGEGPWRVQSFNQHERIIVDKDGRDANPTVRFGLRPAQNTVFARLSVAESIVAKANELLAAQVAS